MNMRDIISLIESKGGHLYHGTSSYGWGEIQDTDSLIDHGEGICFSRSYDVAEDFARLACSRDDVQEGVVLTVDAQRLAADFDCSEHHDNNIDSSWAIQDEKEVRLAVPELPSLSTYLIRTDKVHRDSPWNHGELKGFGP